MKLKMMWLLLYFNKKVTNSYCKCYFKTKNLLNVTTQHYIKAINVKCNTFIKLFSSFNI